MNLPAASPLTTVGHKGVSSLDIVQATGKEHKNVLRDIRTMLVGLYAEDGQTFDDLIGHGSELSHQGFQVVIDHRGYVELIVLDREHAMTLATGYDVKLRKRVIDKLAELESDTAPAGMIAMPNFSDPIAAARAWADQYEARLLADRTKAEIGSRREATAMNTASQAVKKVNRLEVELDRSRSYATIKRMSLIYHGQEFAWRALKEASAIIGEPPINVFDANYGTVKAYHADAWRKAYALEIPEGEAA